LAFHIFQNLKKYLDYKKYTKMSSQKQNQSSKKLFISFALD